MPLGGGKYEEVCESVLKQTDAKLVVVMIIEGNQGNGFSISSRGVDTRPLPAALRNMADQIEADLLRLAREQKDN